jgi:hypothetical protein
MTRGDLGTGESRRTAAAMDAESSLFIRLISVLLLCIAAQVWPIVPVASQAVPASFSFGDSLGDPGNNNYIDSLSKANYPHNGVDFPAGPTGRFTNGRTIVDIVGNTFRTHLPTLSFSVVFQWISQARSLLGSLSIRLQYSQLHTVVD